MRLRTSAFFTAAALALAAMTTVPTAAQPVYSRIVVFGTSLSDPGNAFALYGGTNTPHDYEVDPLLVPNPTVPYVRGGHHFSNGATWVEQFARPLGLAGTVRPGFQASDVMATNFAVGGARAREVGVGVNLPAQVAAFLERTAGAAPADALYVIEMGGNDIRDAIGAYLTGGPGAAGQVLYDANVSIAASIQALYGAGAREFLVWRPPNVALTPAIIRLDQSSPGAAFLASQLSQGFNAGLDAVVGSLSALPGVRIVRLDAFQLLNDIVADKDAFGLTDVTSACITPAIAPFACETPDDFLFWDGIHPTRAAHTIVAQQATQALSR